MNISDCRKRLKELEDAREELLRMLREMRIHSTKSVALIHSGDLEKAEEELKEGLKILEKLRDYRKFPEIYHSLVHDAMQELVEAYAFYKVVRNEFDFSLSFEVEPSAFVTGIADLVGELRRYVLNKLVEGNFEEAERAMKLMEDIYSELITFASLPDKLVPGLRRKLDTARVGIERTKSDYIAAKVARLNESLGGD